MRSSISLGIAAIILFAYGCSKSEDNSGASSGTTTAGTTGGANTQGTQPPASTTTGGAAATTTAGSTTAAAGYAGVQAIFTASCMPCHDSSNHKAGLDLTSYDSLMKGGRNGSVVTAGDPSKSSLIDYLNGTKKPQMPMKAAPLSADKIKTISDWIQAGAKKD